MDHEHMTPDLRQRMVQLDNTMTVLLGLAQDFRAATPDEPLPGVLTAALNRVEADVSEWMHDSYTPIGAGDSDFEERYLAVGELTYAEAVR